MTGQRRSPHRHGAERRTVSDITIEFHALVIGREGIRTDDEGDYLEGEVDFDAVVDGTVHRGLMAKVKQAAGSSFADPLEVQWPARYFGRMPYEGFRDCVERYVREQVSAWVVGAGRPSDRNICINHLRLPAEAACNLRTGEARYPDDQAGLSARNR